MDTGSYMANQMGDLIESGLHQMDIFINDLHIRISEYIKKYNFTWKSETIFDEYINKYTKGYYVSHTCKQIIEEFEDDLYKATGCKSKLILTKNK